MQPVKITIYGDYYDCQIYRGRLYLWTFEGEIKVYKWNELVQSLITDENDKIAITFSFLDGNYLYKSSLIELFRDQDFRNLLKQKFSRIEKNDFLIERHKLARYLFGSQTVPTGILSTDTEIYSNNLYFINEYGLFKGSAHRSKNEKYPVSSKPKKLWDCNLLTIKANKYPQLALSGGDEGLFELNMATSLPTNLPRVEQGTPIYKISKNHSSFSNYSYLNIYNTSLVENSFLATFKWHETNQNLYARNFDKNIEDNEIFEISKDRHYISWGIEDKLYRAKKGGFEIIKYKNNPNLEKGEKKFTKLTSLNLHAWKGKVISGGTAYFGNIVECENALVVIQSNNEVVTIPGPITRWRIYPRSMNYENHLHVILDDRIEIYSFNHDYFLDQEEKKIGIEFNSEKHSRSNRFSYFTDKSSSFFADDNPF